MESPCKLKLQIAGLETEARREIVIDSSATMKQMKEEHFAKEITDGYIIRLFHAGKLLLDEELVAPFEEEFIHCFLSRIKASDIQERMTLEERVTERIEGQGLSELLSDSQRAELLRSMWPIFLQQQPPQVVMLDNNENGCELGVHDSVVLWPTIPGLLCGCCFFPWGMAICLLHREVRCQRCGIRVDRSIF